jgi:hypothetical protein
VVHGTHLHVHGTHLHGPRNQSSAHADHSTAPAKTEVPILEHGREQTDLNCLVYATIFSIYLLNFLIFCSFTLLGKNHFDSFRYRMMATCVKDFAARLYIFATRTCVCSCFPAKEATSQSQSAIVSLDDLPNIFMLWYVGSINSISVLKRDGCVNFTNAMKLQILETSTINYQPHMDPKVAGSSKETTLRWHGLSFPFQRDIKLFENFFFSRIQHGEVYRSHRRVHSLKTLKCEQSHIFVFWNMMAMLSSFRALLSRRHQPRTGNFHASCDIPDCDVA